MLAWFKVGFHGKTSSPSFMLLIILYVSFLTTCQLQSTYAMCLHDQVQTKIKRVEYVGSQSEYQNDRTRKSLAQPDYAPLRIKTYFNRLDQELTDEIQMLVKNVVGKAVEKAQDLLQVIPVQDALLLDRDYCLASFTNGTNKGKCVMKQKGYRGDFCPPDNFKIPDPHLAGAWLWNASHPLPVRELYPAGQGLPNTDYILYVQALSTKTCTTGSSNIIGYATYCKLGDKNRPIAGYINFCPRYFQDPNFQEARAVLIALHELFHALGFSKDLLKKFLDCSNPDKCESWSRPVRTILGVQRLATKIVVQRARAHFGCNKQHVEFGVPMEVKAGHYTSHWDSAFMQGSIMAPSIGLPHLTQVDVLSLAVFEDSSWYKVNYALADNYLWGKDEGCSFGVNCQTNTKYFCTGSEFGCHYLYMYKGQCSTDSFLNNCYIMRATNGGECFHGNNNKKQRQDSSNEKFTPRSRCFVSNITAMGAAQVDTAGQCYEHRCRQANMLEVRVANQPWKLCPFNTKISFSGHTGYLQCPPPGVLCTKPDPPTNPPTTTVASTTPYPLTGSVIHTKITFKAANYRQLVNSGHLTIFRDSVVMKVCLVSGVTKERVSQAFVRAGSIVTGFALMPGEKVSDGPSSEEAFVKLEEEVEKSSFLVTVNGVAYKASSISKSKFPGESRRSLSAGHIAGIVLGVLVLIATVVLTFVLCNRCKATQMQVSPNQSVATSMELGESGGIRAHTTMVRINHPPHSRGQHRHGSGYRTDVQF